MILIIFVATLVAHAYGLSVDPRFYPNALARGIPVSDVLMYNTTIPIRISTDVAAFPPGFFQTYMDECIHNLTARATLSCKLVQRWETLLRGTMPPPFDSFLRCAEYGKPHATYGFSADDCRLNTANPYMARPCTQYGLQCDKIGFSQEDCRMICDYSPSIRRTRRSPWMCQAKATRWLYELAVGDCVQPNYNKIQQAMMDAKSAIDQHGAALHEVHGVLTLLARAENAYDKNIHHLQSDVSTIARALSRIRSSSGIGIESLQGLIQNGIDGTTQIILYLHHTSQLTILNNIRYAATERTADALGSATQPTNERHQGTRKAASRRRPRNPSLTKAGRANIPAPNGDLKKCAPRRQHETQSRGSNHG